MRMGTWGWTWRRTAMSRGVVWRPAASGCGVAAWGGSRCLCVWVTAGVLVVVSLVVVWAGVVPSGSP